MTKDRVYEGRYSREQALSSTRMLDDPVGTAKGCRD